MLSGFKVGGGTDKINCRQRATARRITTAALLALGGSELLAQHAYAANSLWVGGTSANFATAANWSTLPVSGNTLEFNAAGTAGTSLTDNLLTPGSYQISGITFDSTAAAFNISPGSAIINGFVLTGPITDNSANTEILNDSFALGTTPTMSIAGGGTLDLTGSIIGAYGITKSGAGTLNLSGINSYTGATTVSAGTLGISGTITAPASTITIGNTLNQNSTLLITAGANIAAGNMLISSSAAGAGAVYQTGGLVRLYQGYGVSDLAIGNTANGSGYYGISGGTLITNEIDVSGSTGTAVNGVMDVTGGTINDAGWITIQRGSTGAGVLNVNGGTIYAGTALNSTGVSGGSIGMLWGSGSAQLSITNGSVIGPPISSGASGTGYFLALTDGSGTGTSVVNLNSGGLLQVSGVTAGSTNSTSLLNFNGGILKYGGQNAGANTSFLTTSEAADLSGVFIYSGGATIDSNGGAITINKQLQAPTGDGVSGTTITGAGLAGLTTTGYVGAPVVTISGGVGMGATGVATINSSGVLTGITITDAGTGYNSGDGLVITLSGGGVASSTGTADLPLAPNANTGGLTLNGLGQITLGTATLGDTYTGNTTINGGKVTLDFTQGTLATNIISPSSQLVLNGGNLAINGKASTADSQTFNNTTLQGGGVLLTMVDASSNTVVLNLGTITRLAPATMNVTLSGTSSSTNGVIVNNPNNTSGILGGWATIGGTDWATNSTNAAGGNLIAYPGANYNTSFPTSGGSNTLNYQISAGVTLTGPVVANSLKVASGTNVIAMGTNPIAFNGTSGGLLLAGSSVTTFNGSGAGILSAGSGNELIIQDWSSGLTTINAPLLAPNDTGRVTKAGTGPITFNSSNSYTGGTIINGGTVTLNLLGTAGVSETPLGTGTIELNPNGVVNAAPEGLSLVLGSGVTIPNNIKIDDANTGGGAAGLISATGALGAEIDGNITISGPASPGGHFNAPTTAGVYLTITGNIIDTMPPDNSSFVASGTAYTGIDAVIIRSGNVKLFNPGGLSSYYRIDERTGTLQIGGVNGVATNAAVDIGINGNATFDLNGFNQTIVALVNSNNEGNTRIVTNSSVTSASTLTLTPLPAGQIDSNLASSDVLTNASASFPLNLVINGDPTGIQTLSSTASTYQGSTSVLSGTLSIPALAAGGTASSIGASTNAATNLVLGGGTLLYTGATVATDRSFTLNSGTASNINVSSASAVLTFSSAGGVASTTGSLNKLGPGTLVFTGAQGYTGATTVTAGIFQLGSGASLAGSMVVPTGGTFVAAGTVAGPTTIGAGAIFVPGATSYNGSGSIPTVTLTGTATYATGPLTLQKSSVVDFAFGSGINAEINVNGALTLYGGLLDFTNSGSSTAFTPGTSSGTYTLINYTTGQFNGSIGNFTVANAQPGKAYSFGNTGSAITLTIANSSAGSWTNATTDELWTDSGNWLNSTIPNGVSSSANFGADLANSDGNVNLANTNETVGFLNLDNTSTPGNVSFNIESTGSGMLIIDNGAAASPAVTVVAGTHTISAPVQLNAPASGATAFNIASGSSLMISGNISNGSDGAQTVSLTNAGTLILAGSSNTISAYSVAAGALQVGNGGTTGTLGSGSVNLSATGALQFDRSDSPSITNNITGASGTVIQEGTGIIVLAPATPNNFGTAAGGLTILSGGVQLGNTNAVASGVYLNMSGGALDLNANSATVGSLIGGTGTGTGGVITDTNSSAGTTTLTDNWNGAVQTYYGTIADGSTRKLAFNVSGGGTVALAGSNTYSGGTNVTSGFLQALSSNALGSGPVVLSANANSLKISSGVTLPNNVTINAANPGVGLGAITTVNPTDTATYSGTITINALTSSGGAIAGPGTSGLLSFTGPIIAGGTATSIVIRSGIVQLADTTGTSSYPLLIADTTSLSLGHDNGIATNAVLQLSNTGGPGNGTIDLNGYNQTLAGITQVGGVGIITDTNGSAAGNDLGPGTGPNGSSVLTINTSATAFPDTAPDTYAGNINNYVQLIKTGAGTLALTSASNSYFGGTTINQGVLAVSELDAGNTGSANGLGESYIGASDLTFASPGGTLRYTGATSTTGRSFQINDGVTATMDVSTASATLTVSGSASVDGTETTSPASFAKGPGAGTLVLAGTYPYHGNTIVEGGTLLVTGTTGTTGYGAINITSGGTLGGTGIVSGSFNHTAGTIVGGASATTPTTGSLTFTDPVILNGGTDLNNINVAALTNSGVNQQGYITASGGLSFGSTPETVSLQFTGALSAGTFVYNLFDYTGTLGGTPNLTYTTNLGRASFTTDLSTAGEVNVDISNSGAATLFWNSTASSAWDVSSTPNWYNAMTNAPATQFVQGDNVTLADSGSPAGSGTLGSPLQTNINIASGTTVTPGSITVTANNSNYTINGPGAIGGTGALTLSGSSTLTLANNNTYSGATNINGGILSLQSSAALSSLTTISFGGGTLQYSASNTVDYSGQFSTAANQPVAIDTNGQNVAFAGSLVSSGGSLTKLGAGTLTLNSTGNTYSGPTVITAGTLSVSAQGNLGGNGPIVFNGGSLGGSGVTLTNNLVVNSSGGSLVNTGNTFFSGTITGSGTLVSSGSAADVFTGSGFTAGNSSSSASFTGTLVSQDQVNLTDVSASPYASYNASTPSGNSFIFGSATYTAAGPVQLGSLTGVAGSTVRDGNTAGIGPVTWQVGALGTSTTFAGNIADGANGNTSALNKVGAGNLTLSGSNSYTGGTTVTSGTLTLASGNAFPANGSTGTSLTVASGADLNLANHSTNATYVPQMSLLTNSGTIDITNNAFLVHGGSVSAISAQVQAAYANGTWTGTSASNGIITSSLAAADSTHLTAVGVATGLTSFEGIATVLSTDVLVKYTYYGDANLDGKVDGTDYSRIDNGYLEGLTGWYNGDFNYDGVINGSDYTLIDNSYNTQGAQLAAQLAAPTAQIAGSGTSSAVPEPATLGLLGLGAMGLLGRRKRRRC